MTYLHEKNDKFTWKYSDSGEHYENCGWFNSVEEAVDWMTKVRQEKLDYNNSKKHD